MEIHCDNQKKIKIRLPDDEISLEEYPGLRAADELLLDAFDVETDDDPLLVGYEVVQIDRVELRLVVYVTLRRGPGGYCQLTHLLVVGEVAEIS